VILDNIDQKVAGVGRTVRNHSSRIIFLKERSINELKRVLYEKRMVNGVGTSCWNPLIFIHSMINKKLRLDAARGGTSFPPVL